MSKILFINPCAAKTTGLDLWQSKVTETIIGHKMMLLPVLVGMIFAALTPERHPFTYVDEEIEDLDYSADVDLVALTVMSQQAIRAYQIAEEFRKRGKTVIIGGIHAAVMTEEVARHCDVVMIGEGESTWPVMLEDFENGRLKPVYNAKDYPPVDKLISPRVDLIQHDKYYYFPIQATRGCPYNCDFCSIKHASGHNYRMKPVQQVVDEILEYEKYKPAEYLGYNVKGYYFVDDNLYVNREYVKELMTALIPLNIRWDGQGTANMAKDDEILQLMADSGCRTFSIGFESISPETLKEANKPSVNKVEEYEALINNVSKYGIIAGGYFVFGFDTDDVFVFERTVEFVRKTGLLLPILNVLTPYPGTVVGERLHHRVYNESWFFYNAWSTVFTPAKMSADDLIMGSRWAGVQTTKPKLIQDSLKKFWKLGPWKRNPRLTLRERIALILVGLKLGQARLFEARDFLIWSALQKEAVDFVTILWALRRYELSYLVLNAYNPARPHDEKDRYVRKG